MGRRRVGESGNSAVVSGRVIVPRVGSDNDEGMFGDRCECGSVSGASIQGWPVFAAFLAASALLVARRPRR